MSPAGDIRVGVMGVGAIAQVVHLPLLNQLPRVTIRAVCDADESKAEAIAARFGAPIHGPDDDRVIRDDEVDAVIICTPSYLHEQQAIAALEAGKHVLVEKPLALDSAGAARVLEAAKRSGRSLMVAMNNRYRPDAQALKPFAQGGELGDLFLVKAGWLTRKARTVRPTWRHRLETAGGGALIDLGVQILDLARWMLDYPPLERVVAHVHRPQGLEVEDAAAVLFQAKGGPVISVEVTWCLQAPRDEQYLHLLGAAGSGSLAPFQVHKELEQGLIDVTPPLSQGRTNQYTASYRQQLNHFFESARGARERELPHDQVELMRWIELAYRSAKEGKEVKA